MSKYVGKHNAPLSVKDMLGQLNDALSQQAEKPNLYGYRPHEKQEAFHKSKTFGRIFTGGNQSGKTTAGTVEAIWWATKRHPYRKFESHTIAGRICCVDFLEGVERIVAPEVKRWILPSDLKNGSWLDSWDNYRHMLNLSNGSYIEFLTYEQDLEKHAGTKRNFIYFDEEPPEAIFGENMARLLAQEEAGWWIAMTPIQGITWVNDAFIDPPDGPKDDVFIMQVETEENPNLPKGTVKRTLGHLSEDEKKIRQAGSFVPKGGKVYPEFQVSIHATIPRSWTPPLNWTIWMTMDSGINNPTAIEYTAVSPDMESLITFQEFYDSGLIVEDWVKIMKDFEAKSNLTVYCRTADPAMKQRSVITGTSPVIEYGKLGIHLAVDGIPKDTSIGVLKIKQYLRPNPRRNHKPFWEISADRCPKLVDEMKKLQWDYVQSTKLRSQVNKPETIKKFKDHAPDAIRYMFTQFPDLTDEQLKETKSKSIIVPHSWEQTMINMATAPPDIHAPVGGISSPDYEEEFFDGYDYESLPAY